MAIALTNDDGIDAPGLMALREAVAQVSEEPVWLIAPDSHLSGCGHQVTTHQPLRIEERAEGHIAVSGTPADCTRLALTHLCPEARWLLSGINFGGNLGVDEYISGTVAAVREATILGVRAIAFSQYRDRRLPPAGLARQPPLRRGGVTGVDGSSPGGRLFLECEFSPSSST